MRIFIYSNEFLSALNDGIKSRTPPFNRLTKILKPLEFRANLTHTPLTILRSQTTKIHPSPHKYQQN